MRPKLTLHSKLYSLIYDALKDKFTSNEWPASEGSPGGMFGVWEKENADGIKVVKTLFGVNHKYFYERKAWAEDGESITMYTDTLRQVLRYVGCEGETLSLLMAAFYRMRNVPKEIIDAQEQQSGETNSATNGANKGETIYAETITQKTFNNYNINIQRPEISTQDNVSQAVYAFYQLIATGRLTAYERAWELLSHSFKNHIWIKPGTEDTYEEREKEGLKHFKSGYHFFRSLRETHVFNVKIEPTVADCMVYYEEALEIPHIEELADINKTAIKNARGLIDKIEALSKIIEQHGGSGFQDKALIRLFYPTASETVWFEHGVDPIGLKAAFPATTTTTISRLMKCRCVLEEGQWLIDGLIPFHCRQL